MDEEVKCNHLVKSLSLTTLVLQLTQISDRNFFLMLVLYLLIQVDRYVLKNLLKRMLLASCLFCLLCWLLMYLKCQSARTYYLVITTLADMRFSFSCLHTLRWREYLNKASKHVSYFVKCYFCDIIFALYLITFLLIECFFRCLNMALVLLLLILFLNELIVFDLSNRTSKAFLRQTCDTFWLKFNCSFNPFFDSSYYISWSSSHKLE